MDSQLTNVEHLETLTKSCPHANAERRTSNPRPSNRFPVWNWRICQWFFDSKHFFCTQDYKPTTTEYSLWTTAIFRMPSNVWRWPFSISWFLFSFLFFNSRQLIGRNSVQSLFNRLMLLIWACDFHVQETNLDSIWTTKFEAIESKENINVDVNRYPKESKWIKWVDQKRELKIIWQWIRIPDGRTPGSSGVFLKLSRNLILWYFKRSLLYHKAFRIVWISKFEQKQFDADLKFKSEHFTNFFWQNFLTTENQTVLIGKTFCLDV